MRIEIWAWEHRLQLMNLLGVMKHNISIAIVVEKAIYREYDKKTNAAGAVKAYSKFKHVRDNPIMFNPGGFGVAIREFIRVYEK
jgi:hypothetical protein